MIERQIPKGSQLTRRFRSRNPEWENCADPLWLRLEWISVERGRVVLNLEVVYPFQVPQHESRPETHRSPIFQVLVNPFCLLGEDFAILEKFPVMMEIVHADLKSAPRQLTTQQAGNGVISLGNEAKAGTKAQILF